MLAAATILLAGCGNGNSGGSASSSPVYGGVLKVAVDAESPGWVPGCASIAYAGGYIQYAWFDGITDFDKSGNTIPFLASSVTPNADFTQWTVKLKSGVTFSSGAPLTAQSLKDELDNYLKVKGSTAASLVGSIKTATVSDPQTIVFTMTSPLSDFPYTLSQIWAFDPATKDKFGAQDYCAHPIGTGAFQLSSWDRNNLTVAKKVNGYWRKDGSNKLPYLDELDFRPIPNSDSRFAALQSGDVDALFSTDADTLTRASKLPNTKVATYVGSGGYGLFFNNMKAPVDDVRVRRALTEATNKPAVVASGGGDKSYQVVRDEYYAPNSPYYSQKAADATPKFDVSKAKADISGYINDPKRSDGQAVGAPVKIEISVTPDAAANAMVQVVQAEWQQIPGVQVTINQKQQIPLVLDAIKGNFTVNYFGWSDQPPYSLFSHNYMPYPANTSNYAHFNNDSVVSAINQLAQTNDPAKTKQLAEQILMVFAEQDPIIPLTSTPVGIAYNTKKVHNLVIQPSSVGHVDWATVYVTK
jgi:peptide/nickel transport system substrate-binding protein